MKIGVLTYHRSHNYGACLQAYALASWIKENTFIETEIIDYNMVSAGKFYKREVLRGKQPHRIVSNLKRHHMFEKNAMEKLPISNDKLFSDNLSEFFDYIRDKYNIIVVGSDEVWKLGFRGFPNAYFLPQQIPCIKMGYAISARCDFASLGEEKCRMLSGFLDDFSYIGVRDQATLKSVSRYSHTKVNLNCDPTFNYDFHPDTERGHHIVTNASGNIPEKKTIAFMFIDERKANEIKKNLGDQYNYVALYDAVNGVANLCSIDPFEWVDVIASVDFLITNYFHGMCFAIKSNVPFAIVEIRGGKKEDSKSYDLLQECDMTHRFFMKEDGHLVEEICHLVQKDLSDPPDFAKIIDLQQSKSETFMNKLNSIIKENSRD